MSEKCPVCSREVPSGASACPSCGFKLLGATQKFTPLAVDDGEVLDRRAEPPQASLSVVRGPKVGAVYQLSDASMSIGRSPRCTIFLNDMTVSRMHATIQLEGGCYVIRDENSFNGVWVNNDNVEARALRPGDIVQIGTFCMRYEEN